MFNTPKYLLSLVRSAILRIDDMLPGINDLLESGSNLAYTLEDAVIREVEFIRVVTAGVMQHEETTEDDLATLCELLAAPALKQAILAIMSNLSMLSPDKPAHKAIQEATGATQTSLLTPGWSDLIKQETQL